MPAITQLFNMLSLIKQIGEYMKITTGIYQAINESYFIDRFREMGRGNQFSYDGKIALFNYLEQLSEDIGEPIELDVIALCCDYSEYKSLEDFNKEFVHYEEDSYSSWDEVAENTTVIEFGNGSAIVQAF